MCCSALGQIVYGIFMFSALVLTVVGIFTPGWRKVEHINDSIQDDIKNLHAPDSLWPDCSGWVISSDGYSTTKSPQDCSSSWKALPTWNKVVIVTVALAVIVEILALAWNLLTFCACCCKRHLLHPLTGLAILASIFLAITVIVFGVNNKNFICDYNGGWNKCDSGKSNANYSFYLVAGALACTLVSIGIGIIASCFADHSL